MLKKQGYEPGAEFLSQLEEKMRRAKDEQA